MVLARKKVIIWVYSAFVNRAGSRPHLLQRQHLLLWASPEKVETSNAMNS